MCLMENTVESGVQAFGYVKVDLALYILFHVNATFLSRDEPRVWVEHRFDPNSTCSQFGEQTNWASEDEADTLMYMCLMEGES